ncbi:hypothetical protein L218DRAFT_885586, partial [Marasmius fiardii PR-910]
LRFTLNFKRIPYTTVDIGFPDIEPNARRLGAPPTSKNPDGLDKYTVPILVDSFLIASYLDEAYPSTPRLIPEGTEVFQSTFCKTVVERSMAIINLILRSATAEKILPDDFKKVMKESFGEGAVRLLLSLEEQEEMWRKFKRSLVGGLEQRYKGRPLSGSRKAYVMGGEIPMYVDMSVAGHLAWIYLVFGEEDKEWKEIAGLLNGRIEKLVEDILELYGMPGEQ